MTSRISIINNALIATGNDTCAVEFDGSPEWDCAYAGYMRALPMILERGKFSFSTSTAALARTGGAPTGFGRYKHAFAMPAGCLMLVDVRVNDLPVPGGYDIVDNQILTYVDGAVAVFVREPPPNQWPFLFVETATLYTEAHVLRGLNEDYDAAKDREKRADGMFDTAHTRTDQQKPPRAQFKSRIAARRRGNRFTRGL